MHVHICVCAQTHIHTPESAIWKSRCPTVATRCNSHVPGFLNGKMRGGCHRVGLPSLPCLSVPGFLFPSHSPLLAFFFPSVSMATASLLRGWGGRSHRTAGVTTPNHSSQLFHPREAELPDLVLSLLPDPPHTRSQELSCVGSSGAFAETGHSSLLKSRWDTHAGKESLSLFRLCKHLKSHFLFRSVGRMPPSLEASLKRDLDRIFPPAFSGAGVELGVGLWFSVVFFFLFFSLSCWCFLDKHINQHHLYSLDSVPCSVQNYPCFA